LRLWRYAKGRPPYKKQSPKSATRYGGHFVDPENSAAEAEIEQRLAKEFEHPVNQFVHMLDDPAILRIDERRAQLTRYATLLFLRSKSRRVGTKHIQEVKRQALDKFLSNESQLLTIATSTVSS
jgi:predicted metal-binding protein